MTWMKVAEFLCRPFHRLDWRWLIIRCLWCGRIGRNDDPCCHRPREGNRSIMMPEKLCEDCRKLPATWGCSGSSKQIPERLFHPPHFFCDECDRGRGCAMIGYRITRSGEVNRPKA